MIESIEKLRTSVRNIAKGSKIGAFNLVNYKECNLLLSIADEIEREIESCYMLLPVDADGVSIRVGDVMCSAGIREKGHKVIVSAIFEDGFVEYGNDNGLIGPLCQEDWVHIKPRTVEDVLGDFYVAAVKTGGIDALGYQNAIERYAAELRMRDAE